MSPKKVFWNTRYRVFRKFNERTIVRYCSFLKAKSFRTDRLTNWPCPHWSNTASFWIGKKTFFFEQCNYANELTHYVCGFIQKMYPHWIALGFFSCADAVFQFNMDTAKRSGKCKMSQQTDKPIGFVVLLRACLMKAVVRFIYHLSLRSDQQSHLMTDWKKWKCHLPTVRSTIWPTILDSAHTRI